MDTMTTLQQMFERKGYKVFVWCNHGVGTITIEGNSSGPIIGREELDVIHADPGFVVMYVRYDGHLVIQFEGRK